MVSSSSLLIALLTLAAAVLLLRAFQRTGESREEAWRPAALKDAVVVFAEKDFFIETPASIVARVDRVYRRRDMTYVVTELKRRPHARVHRSDQIELSVQRVAIAGAEGIEVSEIGYVVAEAPNGARKAIAVPLLPESAVAMMADRFRRLLAGEEQPARANKWSVCSKCAYRQDCRPSVLGLQRQ